jgi:hypothetical protein
MWVWDERSGQPINVMRPEDRRRFQPLSRHLRIAAAAVLDVPRLWTPYRELLSGAYGRSCPMGGRIGVAVEPRSETFARQAALLEKLGRVPVLVRVYCHAPAARREATLRAVHELHRRGHGVTVALVQDRRAVADPDRWRAFVRAVFDGTAGCVEGIEVGHAINRVKWGVWDFVEYRRLMEGVAEAARDYPGVPLMGPAVIDFEYPFVLAALRALPSERRFRALSHHLYVDRRGAPENRQGPFSALEKFALARAIARVSARCDDRLIVSEVNWPLRGTGVYSPVTSPYESPGPRYNDPSVGEDDYADFMIRYLVIALCSGLVDRVYWWRLVARGFGLVDDADVESWRERPAFALLQTFLGRLGDAVFVEKRSLAPNAYGFRFRCPDGAAVWLAYSSAGPAQTMLPSECTELLDARGVPLEWDGGAVRLSGRPVYGLVPARDEPGSVRRDGRDPGTDRPSDASCPQC